MNFASVRLVTQRFKCVVDFYQTLCAVEPRHLAEGFAEIHLDGIVLAISDERLVRLYNNGLACAAANRSAILEFEVDDVEAALVLADKANAEVVMPITLMPWGNTSALLRDPDGTLVNIFSRAKRELP
ncbi:VOC family protein [Pseudomonas yamanorum]|uniref:VOC family protein n=1 Tax=Pseudomonas yamanorum TaxID=515393 RepID=UPI0015A12499|nr:VOC family protein [Pseudomonas yamanorum]NWE41362.1 VOC family protein [Pseudomonas yamanorum]